MVSCRAPVAGGAIAAAAGGRRCFHEVSKNIFDAVKFCLITRAG